MSISQEVFDSAVQELKDVINTQAELIMLKAFYQAGISIEQKAHETIRLDDSPPKAETSKAQTPKAEVSPKREVPKAEVQKAETPKVTHPKGDLKKKCPRVMKTGEVCDKTAAYEVDGVFHCKRCADVLKNAKIKEQTKLSEEKHVASTSSKAKVQERKAGPSSSGDAFKNLINGIVGNASEKPKSITCKRKKLKDGSIVAIDDSGYVWDPDESLRMVTGKYVDGKIVTLFDDDDHKYITRHKINLADVVQYVKDKTETVVESSGSDNDNADFTDDELVLSDSE
jgi:hypothetical protein